MYNFDLIKSEIKNASDEDLVYDYKFFGNVVSQELDYEMLQDEIRVFEILEAEMVRRGLQI